MAPGEIADGDLADLLLDLDHFISDIRDSLGAPRGSQLDSGLGK